MQRKAFQVQVDLDIQAITCPGVWLCPVGKISLQLFMLDSCIQTASAEPVFPVLCHEKFIFYKTFYAAQKLSELQKLLNKECLYIELIQWQTCELGTVLATFQTNLCELLYPSVHEGAIPGVDIDLLMEPTPNFPGVIAPKIEVCTKTVVEDLVCDGKKESAFVVNPKVIRSKGGGTTRTCPHQRKVCHSTGYNRSRKHFPKLTTAKSERRPIFTYRKVDDGLLSRKPQGLGPSHRDTCKCRSGSKVKNDMVIRTFTEACKKNTNYYECPNAKAKPGSWSKAKPNFFISKVTKCLCPNGHDVDHCPVCSKYTYYFEEDLSAATPRSKKNLSDRKSCICQRVPRAAPDARVIRCRCPPTNKSYQCNNNNNNNNNLKPKQQSLAEKLHQRLTETLDTCADSFEGCRNDDCSDSQRLSPVFEGNYSDTECECPETNIGDFYRKFYRRARSKINCDEYVTPCCI